MPGLSLREAAQQAGTSKSTILRAVKAGRLFAARTDDGGYDIQPAELFRVYPPAASASVQERSEPGSMAQDAPHHPQGDATEILVRNAALTAELKAVREMVEELRRRADEFREDVGHWRGQAERLAIAGPRVTEAPVNPYTATAARPSRSWRLFRRAA